MRKHIAFKNLAAFLAIAATSSFTPAVNATSGTNTIADITIQGTQFARVALNGGAIGGRPSCHNSAYTVHYGLDLSTAKGKALMASLQAAQLAGKRVGASGDGTCINLGSVTIELLQSLTVFTS
jgi:hypothetical protein